MAREKVRRGLEAVDGQGFGAFLRSLEGENVAEAGAGVKFYKEAEESRLLLLTLLYH